MAAATRPGLGVNMVPGWAAPSVRVPTDCMAEVGGVAVLRTWFTQDDANAPGWYRASTDPVIGPALRLLQHNPAHRWTVAGLAAEVGTSRAVLARRFTELVGEPPMTFLTRHRLDLAADLLVEPGTTLGAVAAQVGYSSPYALSAAFKRVRGHTPRQHRQRAAAG